MDALFEKKEIHIAVTGRNLDDLRPLLRMFPCRIVTERPDLVITHGGDGSLLGAERDYPGIPKCPIRDDKQNPKCPRHAILNTLTQLFAGKLKATRLVKLEATLENGEKLSGINDITIGRRIASSAIRYRIWSNGELLVPQVVADSLIVATPFGSTGYFQSITRGNFQTGIGLAFNNSMDLFEYTIVPDNAQLSVQLLRGPAAMVADNDPRQIDLETDAVIHIQATPATTILYGLDIFRCLDCFDLRKRGRF
ncbi:MAG: NAD(+)/NADH kinase [Victivallales bacterium]|nr:NAD(+)/NADH kinase [Victivallales bacterium]